MEQSYTKENIELKLLVTPVLTLTGRKYSYRLLDSAYGEWLVFEDNAPKYYLNIFDVDYGAIKKITVDSNSDVTDFLQCKFSSGASRLKLTDDIFGIKLNGKSFIKSVSIEKLPISLIN